MELAAARGVWRGRTRRRCLFPSFCIVGSLFFAVFVAPLLLLLFMFAVVELRLLISFRSWASAFFVYFFLIFFFSFDVQVFPVRRPGRGPLDYRDSAYESRRQSQFTGGISLENFRFISVLGRGHFGKVSLPSSPPSPLPCSSIL